MKPNVLDSVRSLLYFAAGLTLQVRRSGGGRSEGIRPPSVSGRMVGDGVGGPRRASQLPSLLVRAQRFNMCGSPARRGRASSGIMAKV